MADNNPYIVSARKYRPATFRSVVGQEALTTTLKNAVDSKRLAQAYLFCGPRGVGKTSCARIFAKTINCLHPTPDGEACGECESCVAIDQGNSFNLTELDAASNNSVADIRELTQQVNVPPQTGKYRVFIIDEVHMLSTAAFNAFLKTLEEPPAYVIFILATTEKHKVIPTILSRCQIYDFKRITIDDMARHLAYVAEREGITAEPEALNVIARKADGAMRDALSIFDQVSASTQGHITYEATIANLNVLDYEYYFRLVEAFRAGDVGIALLIYKEIRDKGFDSLFFVNGLAGHIRDLMVAADPQTAPLLEVAADVASRYTTQSQSLPIQWYYAAMRILNECDINYRTATSKRLTVEVALIRLCQLLTPPTPPFDRVDSGIPLGAVKPTATAPSAQSPQTAQPAQTVTQTQPAASPQPTQPTEGAQSPRPAAAPQPVQPAAAPKPAAQTPQSAQGATAPRPAAKVTAGAVAAGVRKLKKGAPPTVKISTTADSHASYGPSEPRRGHVDEEMFAQAWVRYMAQHPHEQILTSAMRKATPKKIDDITFSVTVDHPALQQAFESAQANLIPFLREELGNDFLALRVELDTTVDQSRMLPPKEFLQKIVSENPVLAETLRIMDAELS